MKRLFFFFILLVFSVWLGIKIQADPGMVYIRYHSWSIETTLWFALLSFLMVGFLLYAIYALLGGFIRFPRRILNYFRTYSKHKSQQEMLEGFSLLLEEEGAQAEKFFVKAAKQNTLPFMNYLLAAMALTRSEQSNKQNYYLDKAAYYADHPHLKAALEFFKIKLEMEAEDWSAALSRILPLYEKKPSHPTLLRRLKKIYLKMERWESLYHLLPALRKVLDTKEWQALECEVYRALLCQWVQQNKGSNALLSFWKQLPSWAKNNSRLIIAYVRALTFYDLKSEAEKVLIGGIKHQLNKELIILYSQLDAKRADKQIAWIESLMLKQLPDDQLCFHLGCLCARHYLWGKAEFYLNKSLEINPGSNKALYELGNVFLQTGDRQKALEIWSKIKLNPPV